jgi:arginine-tRNA-protein transferase
MDGNLYHHFMDAAFRRTGQVFYQPVCNGCRQCVPIRVPVATFQPTKSQRRCWRRNQDLNITIAPPQLSDEKFELYLRFLKERHPRESISENMQTFQEFLYTSPIDTIEFTYRDVDGRLLAVGICDICSRSLSSVYFFFDPNHAKRGLGVFGVLKELDFAREKCIEHYYLGYWVSDAPSMSYKKTYGPHQLLFADNQWQWVHSAKIIAPGLIASCNVGRK